MFGLYRTMLALMVVFHHLLLEINTGRYAVFGFYLLSGYLMTLIMHDSYGYTKAGRLKFTLNRFLRLYPTYWVACLISLFLILFYGENLTSWYYVRMRMPTDLTDILANITMMFPFISDTSSYIRFVDVAWSLSVEIFFYALICIGISKTYRRVIYWLAISLVYIFVTYMAEWSADSRYYPLAAASLPFSLGALLYFLPKTRFITGNSRADTLATSLLFVAIFANAGFWMMFHWYNNDSWFDELGYYMNLTLCFYFVYNVVHGGKLPYISVKMDKLLGDLSYPIYLIHIQIGVIVAVYFNRLYKNDHTFYGLGAFILSTVLILFISYLMAVLLDRPVNAIRDRIKHSK